MNSYKFSTLIVGMMLLWLSGCNQATQTPTIPHQNTAIISSQASATIPPQASATIPPQATATTAQASQTPNPFVLAVYGKYQVGTQTIVVTDPSRGNRQVSITVWYPAVLQTESTVRVPISDAEPDRSGAPYPLILSSTKIANIFAPYLVSHGFAWASVDGIDYYMAMNEEMIDQPLDILFALDQVDLNPPESLKGLIDAEKAGAIGYSFDGYNALALSGARIDPEYYLAQCPTPDATTKAILGGMSAFGCGPAGEWDQFVAHVDKSITASKDGLWQPLTDKRIRAVMPMAGEGWWLFGKRGLAAVDRPVLIIDSTNDELYKENVLIYEHLGTSDKTLISFVGKDHMMIYETEMIERMAHFAVAFFGYHLQSREELARYFSEDFVAQQDNLAWGVYPGK